MSAAPPVPKNPIPASVSETLDDLPETSEVATKLRNDLGDAASRLLLAMNIDCTEEEDELLIYEIEEYLLRGLLVK